MMLGGKGFAGYAKDFFFLNNMFIIPRDIPLFFLFNETLRFFFMVARCV